MYPYPYEQYANEVKQTLDQLPWERLHRMVEMLETARLERRQVFIMGNGGSAAQGVVSGQPTGNGGRSATGGDS